MSNSPEAHVQKLFIFPPTLYLPGALLPSVASSSKLKLLHPSQASSTSFTSLILTHAASASDVAIAGMIWHLPSLQVINLKGCSLAGENVVSTIIKRCPNLTRINVKMTGVNEEGIGMILKSFQQQLLGFKVDTGSFEVRVSPIPSSADDLGYSTDFYLWTACKGHTPVSAG